MDSSELVDNAGNFRQHPRAQQDAFEGMLGEIGRAGALVAYHSERNDGALTLIDGHLRRGMGGSWTVLITDLVDNEADKLLQAYDPISHMAVTDRDMLRELRDRAEFADRNVQSLIDTMIVPDNLIGALPEVTPFQPNTMPETSQTEVSASDVQNAKAKQESKMGDLATADKNNQLEVTCPHCGEDFFINKYAG